MNKKAAYDLLDLIAMNEGDSAAEVRTVSDGNQYIVVIKKGPYFCWVPNDYIRWRQQRETRSKRKEQANAS